MDIIRRLVAGQTQTQIARELGYTDGRLSIIVNSPLFQIKLKAFEKQVNDKVVDNVANFELRVRKLQEPALDTIEGLMKSSKNERLKRDCAKDVLELGGNIKKDRDSDGMNEFARIIADAFNQAQVRNAIDITPGNNHVEEGRLIEVELEEDDLQSGIETSSTQQEHQKSDEEQVIPPPEAVETPEKQTINRILNALLKD